MVSFIKLDQRVSQSMNATTGMVRTKKVFNMCDIISFDHNGTSRAIISAFLVVYGPRVLQKLCQWMMLALLCGSAR